MNFLKKVVSLKILNSVTQSPVKTELIDLAWHNLYTEHSC